MDTETILGHQLFFDLNMEEAEIYPIGGGEAAVFSCRCPAKETPNEDAAAVIQYDDNSCVLAVADGLGGGPAGEEAANLALEIMKTSIDIARQEDLLLRSAIMDGFEKSNSAVQELGVGAATTMALVEISGNVVRPYHVGDSMILVVGLRGKIKLQTIAHSPLGYAVESGIIDEADALHHEERHFVSNVIGIPEMRIEVGPSLTLAARDTILLATDGLFDNLYIGEIVERSRKGPLLKAVQKLATDALERMHHHEEGVPSKPDDMTIIAYRGKRK